MIEIENIVIPHISMLPISEEQATSVLCMIMKPIIKIKRNDRLAEEIKTVWEVYLQGCKENEGMRKKYEGKIKDRFDILDIR